MKVPKSKKTDVREPIRVPKSMYVSDIDIPKEVNRLPEGIVSIGAWTLRRTPRIQARRVGEVTTKPIVHGT